MRAIGIPSYGSPDVLAVVERPVPEAGPGQVRIKVAAAAVNPTDLMLRSGELAPYMADFTAPYTPGMDVSGHIDALGPDTAGFAEGDRVVAFVNPFTDLGGAQAEYVVVPADQVAALPDTLPLVEAAGLPMNALTAHQALDLADLAPGATVAVTGAAGALGGYAVQLAAQRGLRVVADARDEDRDLVLGLGAHTVVPRHADPQDTVAAYRAALPHGADAVVDAAVLGAAALDIVADGGHLVRCRPYDLPAPRGIVLHQAFVVAHPDKAGALRELVGLAALGALSLRTADRFAPEEAAEAHRRLEKGGVRGRQLIVF
ncbi:NADP-dependent oxidoreductase [Streptomyces sp. Ag109_G2-15]|uniref:NADP-dependent oxidoreductase n=1 Tax=Streptomyces sp. Ag109_G2-15 TaxID=1938850 RepID=UPI000BC7340D|nr:NADP-dependent oxidoreductase [Streptomyces sp. Ag109_G2-15]SOD85159.1 NADPH:quinone reductase [Streptomyces sp. Ag109_G2-15]